MGVGIEEPTTAGRMSGERFRLFQEGRPDHERWELVGGVPMMMTPPTIAHNRIAGNLERLLYDALASHDQSRIAMQRPGIELGSGEFRPEPDVAVIDAEYEPDQRFVERAYLLAEIVSATDDTRGCPPPRRGGSTSNEPSTSRMRPAKRCSSSSRTEWRSVSTPERRVVGTRKHSAGPRN
jgi:hypothetical protein